MAIKFNEQDKKVKSYSSSTGKGCTATLVIQIILVIALGALALAPLLSAVLAIFLFFFVVIGVIVSTVVTLGLAWFNTGFKNFWANVWSLVKKAFKDPDTIKTSIKPIIIWLAIVIFVVSTVGFIYNLVYFIKKDKENKGRFITSCIFLVIGLGNVFLAYAMYLK